MTSQVLISNHLSETSETKSVADVKTRPSETIKKLPYQANHQVELLNLQAETEALLQQLRLLKQQRSIPVPADLNLDHAPIRSLEAAI